MSPLWKCRENTRRWATIAAHLGTIINTLADIVSAENQLKMLKAVIKEAPWKGDFKTAGRLYLCSYSSASGQGNRCSLVGKLRPTQATPCDYTLHQGRYREVLDKDDEENGGRLRTWCPRWALSTHPLCFEWALQTKVRSS